MKTIKTIVSVLCILCAAGCAQTKDNASKYANRAEAIAAQMHDPASKYVVVACHRGDWRNFPENSAMAIVDIQKEKGIKLYNSYMEQGVVPLAYEVCWQSEDGTFERPELLIGYLEKMGRHTLK